MDKLFERAIPSYAQYKLKNSNIQKQSMKIATNCQKLEYSKFYKRMPSQNELKEKNAKKCGYRLYYNSKNTGIYRGWWKDNKRHGFGTQLDGSELYEGIFFNDERTGNGVLSEQKSNGSLELKYEGTFVNGVPNGEGELHSATHHYLGYVKDGKEAGSGIAWFNDGTVYYGSWYDGKRMGLGMMVEKNGNRYEGNWYNDVKNGYGEFFFFNKGQALSGVWVGGVFVTGTVRNIKFRQAAVTPVKYPIPEIKLKDWEDTYHNWEKGAFEGAGKYVQKDLGLIKKKDDIILMHRERARNINKMFDRTRYPKMIQPFNAPPRNEGGYKCFVFPSHKYNKWVF